MHTFIALFRGINVGGHNKLLMKDLRALMESLGYQNVDTYIQTGNVVFQTEEKDKQDISNKISNRVKENHGFKPDVLLLELEEMEKAVASNPFSEGESNPRFLYLFFLASSPSNPDLEALENFKVESERFKLKDKVFYLYAPKGIGRSKLAAKIGKFIDVSMTSRNWRTVQKIMEMVEDYQ